LVSPDYLRLTLELTLGFTLTEDSRPYDEYKKHKQNKHSCFLNKQGMFRKKVNAANYNQYLFVKYINDNNILRRGDNTSTSYKKNSEVIIDLLGKEINDCIDSAKKIGESLCFSKVESISNAVKNNSLQEPNSAPLVELSHPEFFCGKFAEIRSYYLKFENYELSTNTEQLISLVYKQVGLNEVPWLFENFKKNKILQID
jgi:hypothetical protein